MKLLKKGLKTFNWFWNLNHDILYYTKMISVVSKVTLLIPGKPLQALWSKLFNSHRNKSDSVKGVEGGSVWPQTEPGWGCHVSDIAVQVLNTRSRRWRLVLNKDFFNFINRFKPSGLPSTKINTEVWPNKILLVTTVTVIKLIITMSNIQWQIYCQKRVSYKFYTGIVTQIWC